MAQAVTSMPEKVCRRLVVVHFIWTLLVTSHTRTEWPSLSYGLVSAAMTQKNTKCTYLWPFCGPLFVNNETNLMHTTCKHYPAGRFHSKSIIDVMRYAVTTTVCSISRRQTSAIQVSLDMITPSPRSEQWMLWQWLIPALSWRCAVQMWFIYDFIMVIISTFINKDITTSQALKPCH